MQQSARTAHGPVSRSAFTLIELLVVIAIIAILAAILFPVFAQARAKARQTACLSNMKQIGMGINMYVQDYDEVYPVNNWTYDLNNYCADQGGWMQEIQPYIKNTQVYVCPDAIKRNTSTDFCTIPGANNTASGTITVPWFHYGANEYVVSSVTPSVNVVSWKGNISLAAIGRPAELPLVADSMFITFDDAARIMNANYPGNPWWNYPGAPDKTMSRHSGGSSIAFGDGHAKWVPQTSMNWDPSLKDGNGAQCASSPQTNNPYCWRLPIHPSDPRLQ